MNNPESEETGNGRAQGQRQARFAPAHPAPRCVSKILSLALPLIVSFSVVALAPTSEAKAQAKEYEVKAAVLYYFVKYVEWPSAAFSHGGAPFVVGVIGDDPFGSAIDQAINGKTVNGHHMTIRRLKWGQNMRDCHILFVSSSEQKRLPQILESLNGANVLTVGEMDRFSQQGGIIGLVMENSKVRFEINKAAADQARLKISSRLLELARKVITGKGRGD